MKAHLLFVGGDLDLGAESVWNAEELRDDLGLDTVVDAMAGGDEFLQTVARAVLLAPLTDPAAIRYRQDVFADCIAHRDLARAMYDLAGEAIDGERRVFRSLFGNPALVLSRAVQVLQLFVPLLHRLRELAEHDRDSVGSEGMRGLLTMLCEELDDEYFALIGTQLRKLKFDHAGVLISAGLGDGNKGRDYVLRDQTGRRDGLLARLTGRGEPSYTFAIAPRDEAGARALTALRDRGVNQVANALAQSTDHILSFFQMLRTEIGFYLGCVNLHDRLSAKGEPTCLPDPRPLGERIYRASALYDVGLSVRRNERVVGNDLDASGKTAVVITGANTGGKSTFLRSVGVAQLMMQAGMFVGAESFAANVCAGIVTHYKREEDATMASGKLDEELGRLSLIADHVERDYLLLSNESFSSTNEQEGAEIGRQAWHAMLSCSVEIFFVTHLFDLADGFRRSDPDTTLFLRAERGANGERSFRLDEGEPLPTAYGPDLFTRVFGDEAVLAGDG